MSNTNTMADNAVRCNRNRASDSNRMGDGNGTSDGNRASDGNRVGNSMADNAMANSDGNIRVGSSAVVGDLGHLCHT